jgi:hypothetical protein
MSYRSLRGGVFAVLALTVACTRVSAPERNEETTGDSRRSDPRASIGVQGQPPPPKPQPQPAPTFESLRAEEAAIPRGRGFPTDADLFRAIERRSELMASIDSALRKGFITTEQAAELKRLNREHTVLKR